MMLFRVLIIAFITYVVYSLYRRFLRPASNGKGASPFSRASKRRRPTGNAVDADFEELDDENSDH